MALDPVSGSLSGAENSTAVYLPSGSGAVQFKGTSSFTGTFGFSLDGGITFDPDSNGTSITADGVYAIDLGAPGHVRIEGASGSCDYTIKPRPISAS